MELIKNIITHIHITNHD